ncbi:MAG TPA: hypothetical protein ENJ45_01100 [Phaeodactylibacter sp.]|nr:hypothetical protein [Phaeodactylibacter sp.]
MKSFLCFLSLCTLLLLAGACHIADKEAKAITNSFFDLKGYFQKEYTRLKNASHITQKTISLNGKSETKELEGIDFSQELAAFASADINRIAWKDKYRIDSLKDNLGQLKALHYTAIDKNMKTRRLYVSFQKAKVDSIYIKKEVEGFAVHRNSDLIYLPDKGYRISIEQGVLGSEIQHIRIEGTYF